MMVCIHGNRSEENMVGISETPGKKRTERTIKRREAAGWLHAREFDTSKLKRILQSLETGLFFCQIFVFII